MSPASTLGNDVQFTDAMRGTRNGRRMEGEPLEQDS